MPAAITLATLTVNVVTITPLADEVGANIVLDVPGVLGSLLWTTPDATGIEVGMSFTVTVTA